MKSQALTPPHTTRHQNKYQIRSCDLYGKNHFAFHRSQRRNVKNDDKSDGRHHLAPLPPKKSSSRDHKSNHHRTSRHERSRSEERHSRHNDADKDKHNRRRSDKNDAKERRSRSNVKEQDSYV